MVGGEPAGPIPDFRDERLDRVALGADDAALASPSRRGRPRKAVDQERLTEVVRLYFVERLSMRRIAGIIGVSHMSVYRILTDPNLELLI